MCKELYLLHVVYSKYYTIVKLSRHFALILSTSKVNVSESKWARGIKAQSQSRVETKGNEKGNKIIPPNFFTCKSKYNFLLR